MSFHSTPNSAQIKLTHLFTISKVGKDAEDIVASKWFSLLKKLSGINLIIQNSQNVALNTKTPSSTLKRSSSEANLRVTKIKKVEKSSQMNIEHLPQLNELFLLITTFNAISDKNAKSIDQIFAEIVEKSSVNIKVLPYVIAGENNEHKYYLTKVSIGTLTVVESKNVQDENQALENAKKEVIAFIDNARIAAYYFHQGTFELFDCYVK